MNKIYELSPSNHSEIGIFGRIYAQPKKVRGRRGSLARMFASVVSFVNRMRAIKAVRLSATVFFSAMLLSMAVLLETGILPVFSALILGSVCATFLGVFLRKSKNK